MSFSCGFEESSKVSQQQLLLHIQTLVAGYDDVSSEISACLLASKAQLSNSLLETCHSVGTRLLHCPLHLQNKIFAMCCSTDMKSQKRQGN